MSRRVHKHGKCIVSHVYMQIIIVVYTCTDLIVLTAGLFGNYPSSSILHRRAWRWLWRCWRGITFQSGQYVVCASPAVLPLYAASHRYCSGRSDEDIPLDLVFFSPFEELRLRAGGIMESKGIHRYMSPHLFPLSTSEGLRTSSAEPLSFHAFWTEMQPQLFHISTAADSWTLLSVAVPMVLALPRGGMFTRSALGCGTLDGPTAAPASRGRPLCGQDWEDPKEVPVRGCQTSVGNKAGQDCQVTGIYTTMLCALSC